MRSLPRRNASPAFTSEVLRKVRAERSPAPFVWRFAAAIAVAAGLVTVAHLGVVEHSRRERMAELRVEQQQLESELEAVKETIAHADPVVVLENGNGTRVIVDLGSDIQLASHRTFD